MTNTERSSETDDVNICEKDVIKKKVTLKDLEKWEVALLNSNIEPCSSPSDLFEKLEKRRKRRHEQLLQELAKNLHDVNLKTEKNISLSSTELKAHMKNFEEKLKSILENIDKPEITSYCSFTFTEIQTTANEYKSEQEKLVKELYEDLIKFENERATQNEKLLQLACEEMRKIGYFFPYEVQMFVEHETLKMNQLSLNNRRCYEDVKLTLTLVTEQTFKSFMDKVYCIREKWIQRKLIDVFYELQNDAEKKVDNIIPEAYNRLEVKGQELDLQISPDNLYSTCKAEEWARNVEEAITNIDFHCQNLIHIYKETMEGIYKGFDKEVKEIKSQFTISEDLNFEERVVRPIIFEAENDQKKEIEELESFWQKTLEGIRNHFKEVKDFLLDAGKLWDEHLERVCESKKLILKALEKERKTNQDALQDLETKLNISLDALRQEHNPAKLQKAYEAVTTILNSIKSKYESIYLGEVSTIEDFYKMMNLEADVLSAAIKEFIYEIHAIDHKVIYAFNEQVPFLSRGKLIVKEIQFCAARIQAAKWWKKGVWVALETLSENTRQTLKPRAENWVEKKIKILAEQKSIQLELLDKRYQRIRSEIFEKRIEEIETHQTMFNNHKEKIENEIIKIKEDLQFLIAKELNKLNLIKDNLTEMETNLKTEDRARVIYNNQTMLEKRKEELENELKMTFERFRADCNAKLSNLKQDNIKYMKSIRLFHENGNYNSEEGKGFVNSLELLDKKIDSDIKGVINNANKEEVECSKKLVALFTPLTALLSLLYDETQFSQDTQQKLRTFTLELQSQAKALKQDYGYLNKQSYCLCLDIKNPNKNKGKVDEKFWNSVIELLYKNISGLLYPVTLPETSEIESHEESLSGEGSTRPPCCADKFSIHLSTPKTITFRTTEKEPLTCKDYKPELFNCDKPPVNDGTFMSRICNIFWTEIDSFQILACNFYKKLQGRKIIRTDLIPLDYDKFMSEILSKFINYHNQIEQFWLQIILDFLPLFGQIKSLANYYLQQKLLNYENLALKAVEEYENEFLSCLESRKADNHDELEALEKKLLPLHGYPHNENLLSDLEEEVVRRTASHEVKREALIKKFKSQLKCFRVYHIIERQEINKIKHSYLKLKDTIFVSDITTNMLNILLDYCVRGELYIKQTSSVNMTDSKSENKSQASEQIKGQNLNLEMISETRLNIQSYLKKLKDIIEREQLSDGILSECPPCSDESDITEPDEEDVCKKFCEPKLDILLEILNFEELVYKISEKVEQYIRRLKSFADSEEKSQEIEMLNWLTKWKFNVRKVLRLYRVKYEEKPENLEDMQEVPNENNKPKTEKTSASVTSTLPRPCPTTNFYFKDTSCYIPKLKNRYLGNNSILNEKKKHIGDTENLHSNTHLHKSKLTELKNSNRITSEESATLQNSLKNYHGHIPVRHRHSLHNIKMPPVTTRSPSPDKKVSPKEKFTCKVKVITLDQDTKKKKNAENCRNSSPVKPATFNVTKTKQRTSIPPNSEVLSNPEKISDAKRIDTKRSTSTKINPKARKSKEKSSKELKTFNNELKKSVVIKQSSQPSLSMTDKIQPQEKISLDHLKSEVYSGDHTRLSFEKVQLCIEKSINLSLHEKQRSHFVTYSAENARNRDGSSLTYLQNSTSFTTYSTESDKNQALIESSSAIKTLSGNELKLTPSMKLHIEEGDTGSEELEISEILNDAMESIENQKEVLIPQDDANEYDSEVSTDGELVVRGVSIFPSRVRGSKSSENHRKNALWKSREEEMLSDVDYRQSVYHPAVSRRHKKEKADMEFRSESKSIEDDFSDETNHSFEDCSNSFAVNNKYASSYLKQTYNNNDRPWISAFDKTDDKLMFNSVIPAGSFYGVKRIRTKKERVSGALLHFTLKMIRLLAIFNLWPGDNCHMLTSQSLRLVS